VLRRRWRWIVLTTVLGTVAAFGYSQSQPRIYEATASAFFSLQYGDSAADLVQGSTYTQNQIESFARLATTPAVLTPVIQRLDLDLRPRELAGRVHASAPLDTVIVDITVSDRSPETSQQIANEVAESLSVVVEDVAPKDSRGNSTVRVITVAEADLPSAAVSPDVPLDVAVGLLLSLLLGLGAAWLREMTDNRVRDAGEIARITTSPLLGSIGARIDRRHPVVVESDPHSPHAEAFRQLRTNLQFLEVGDAPADGRATAVQVVVVTSSLSAEGKTTIAANLAVALAETSARVLLVDTDLRRPAVARLLGLEGAAGLSTVLLGRVAVADVVQDWGESGLQVLPSGPVPPNPSELLGSATWARLLEQLRRDYDFVVLDAPPLLPVADAAILSRTADGAVVVANATRVRRHQLVEALRSLRQVNGRVLGVVLNQVRRHVEAYDYRPEDAPVDPAERLPILMTRRPALFRTEPAAGRSSSDGPAVDGAADDAGAGAVRGGRR
jgi:capsular exopolysaccharide synthesis family protein